MFRADGARWYVSYGGTSTWQLLATSGYRLDQLIFADFDGDGKADVFRADGSHSYVSYGGGGSWQKLKQWCFA